MSADSQDSSASDGLAVQLHSDDTSQTGATESNAVAEDWRSGIEDPALRDFARRFNSPADAVKTALEFRRKLSTAVVLPGKEASDEERAEFHRKLGVPDTPEAYGVAVPEGFPEELAPPEQTNANLQDFARVMHQAGAPQAVVDSAVGWFFGWLREGASLMDKTAALAREEIEASLRREWGGDYERNAEAARRAARLYGGEGFMDFMTGKSVDGVPLGSHPQFIRAFSAIGRRMIEDGLHPSPADGGRQSVDEGLSSLTADAHDALAAGDRSRADQLFAERDNLAERLYGGSE